MKTITIIVGALLCAVLPSLSGEHYTLTAENAVNQSGDSQAITLNQGDTAELKFAHHSAWGQGDQMRFRMIVNSAGKEFEVPALTYPPNLAGGYAVHPVKVAGPAVIKMRIGVNASVGATTGIATIEVNRAGTAGTPAGIPLEAGTTWQVILEASTDLVNWTAVAPGDYPSASPQRFFRTRLVKRP